MSYLLTKYKEYLKNIYIYKTALVKATTIKNEKFSVIRDILKFIKFFKEKYIDDFNIINILQGDREQNEIINKVCNHLLDFYFDLDFKEEYIEENSESDGDNLESDIENGNKNLESNDDLVENESDN